MSTVDLDRIVAQALRLSQQERGQLLARLIDTLDDAPPLAAEDWERAWAEEITRRLAALDSGRTQAIPWEDVRRELMDESEER